MILVKKQCRVCGEEFEPCATCQMHFETKAWKLFVCSEECWDVYFKKVSYQRREQDYQENKQMYENLNAGKLETMDFPDDVVEVVERDIPPEDEFIEDEPQDTVLKRFASKLFGKKDEDK